MKVSKYIHACLLVEEQGEKLLFDPGKFSFIEGRVQPEQFRGVSTLVLTHAHPDHLDFDALRVLLRENAGLRIYANSQAFRQMRDDGIEATIFEEGTRTLGGFTLEAISARHEKILGSPAPQNTAWMVNGKLLITGDSFDSSLFAYTGVELAAVPVMAPYLTEVRVATFVEKLAPKQLLPMHDGYAKDFFLKLRYEAYTKEFAKFGTKFLPAVAPGYSLEI
jgi:L-ascorbate metabolism protein UlaG (beta-lactamase superfamily)